MAMQHNPNTKPVILSGLGGILTHDIQHSKPSALLHVGVVYSIYIPLLSSENDVIIYRQWYKYSNKHDYI